jgi:hypothetical protein
MRLRSTIPVAVLILGAAGAALAEEPFQAKVSLTIPAGVLEDCPALATVPAGKRLTIEYVAAGLKAPIGQKPWLQMIGTTLGGVHAFHMLNTETTGFQNNYVVAQPVRLYADPGTSVGFCFHRTTSNGELFIYASLSGVLTDVP